MIFLTAGKYTVYVFESGSLATDDDGIFGIIPKVFSSQNVYTYKQPTCDH